MFEKITSFNPRWFKAIVYGANDGIVTTFAVVAGASGADFSAQVVIILGLANLIGDGLSMGLGDFLGERSERKLRHQRQDDQVVGRVWETGLLTFISFLIAGTMPLMPFFLNALFHWQLHPARYSMIFAGLTLFIIGSLRTLLIKGKWWRNGLEMFSVGMLAAGAAFLLGSVAKSFIGSTG